MKTIPLLAVLALLAACANPRSSVIVDKRGVDPGQYSQDLAECGGYADQVPVTEDMARGAGRGIVVGGAIGAIIDGADAAARGAGIGGVAGGAKGFVRAEHEQGRVVKNCMRGRGYRGLN